VKDPYDRAGGANPNYRWSLKMTWASLRTKLANSFGSFGKLKKLVIVHKGVSGRVAFDGLKIVGSERTIRVSGWATRTALGLKDTWFRFKVIPATTARAAASNGTAPDGTAEEPREPKPTPSQSPTPSLSPSPTPSPSS
jgi:hypothetical protein